VSIMIRIHTDSVPNFTTAASPNAFASMQDLLPPDARMDEADLAAWKKEKSVIDLRSRIHAEVGDVLSLLGTASDGASLAFLSTVAMTVAIADSPDFATFQTNYIAIVEGMSEESVVDASRAFLAGIQSGDIVLPPMAKGFDEVVAELISRGHGVTTIIADHRAAPEEA